MLNKYAGLTICVFDFIFLIIGVILGGELARNFNILVFDDTTLRITQESLSNRLNIFMFTGISTILIFYNRGHYSRIIPWWSQVRYILQVIFIMMVIDGFIHFIVKNQFSRSWIIMTWIVSFFSILIARYLARYLLLKLSMWKVPTVIIGDSDNIIETLFALGQEYYAAYDIEVVINTGKNKLQKKELPQKYKNVSFIQKEIDLFEYITNNKKCFYILAPDNSKNFRLDELINKICCVGSRYALVPPLEGTKLYGSVPQYFFGHDIMFLFSRRNVLSPFGKVVKRVLDLLVSLVLLIICMPIFIIISIVIKKDGGSIFFSQYRVGRNDVEFKCYKFRSMAADAEDRLNNLLASDPKMKEEWQKTRKLKNDPRITKIGNFLRKTSLDELPQLINVLKGEMSLVGPRPIVSEEKKYYKDKINEYIAVRPGITGLWQVSGRNDVSYKYRVHLDSWYVNNWSLWSDIVILNKTFMVVFTRMGAY